MKIGILTFHWATNYGAVLQCFALQQTLVEMGHQVEIINYKPRRYDDSLYQFLRQRKFLRLREYFNFRQKEKCISEFRSQKLKLTRRVSTQTDMSHLAHNYDIVISGSDQVMNPHFLMNGEKIGKITPSYFLGFPCKCKRIGYAVSFGCVNYPQSALQVASSHIKKFDAIGVREHSGIDIVKSMGRSDALVVPDPTILMPSTYYLSLADECGINYEYSAPYVYSFFIRNISDRRKTLGTVLDNNILWNNDDTDYTVQGWLCKIKKSQFVITDSFHCMVMCVKLHKPFIVVTNEVGNIGMNDRFFTLLTLLDLDHRLVDKEHLFEIKDIMTEQINWSAVDFIIEQQKEIGLNFLYTSLS